MAPEFPQRVRQLFDEALQRPDADRLLFVMSACGGDATLFQAVERLLRARGASESFLESDTRPTERIGRYVIRGELGRGAMGIVYDAMDPMIGRSVAVKVIHLKAVTEPGAAEFLRERLFREARSAGQLFHPGIVIIFDVGQEQDRAFIAMERVDGSSLQQILGSGRRFSAGEALGILRQTAAALDYAHGHGIVHRDIKPANIMLQNGVTVKVADFGIAKIMTTQHQTLSRVVMGTPSYMSPEQIEARPVDGRSDQFSLAVLAYELLVGIRPFEADSIATLAHLMVYGERPSARTANPALPPAVDEVFQRGLARHPEERFANCLEFVAALEAAVTLHQAVKAPIPDPPPAIERAVEPVRKRASSRWPYLAGAASIVLMLALAFLFYKYKQPVPAAAPAPLKTPDATVKPAATATQIVSAAPLAPSPPPVVSAPKKSTETDTPRKLSLEPKPEAVPASTRAWQFYKAALAKRREGRPQDAVPLFRLAADLGETGAMAELGESYRAGEGVAQDQNEALRWFRKAADAGNSSAMVSIGAMYFLGDGIDASDEEAARWYQKAADRDNPAGTYDLGTMYEDGRGVARNVETARQLYLKAASLGNTEAQKRLAQLERNAEKKR